MLCVPSSLSGPADVPIVPPPDRVNLPCSLQELHACAQAGDALLAFVGVVYFVVVVAVVSYFNYKDIIMVVK